jgi:hypothetical protein
VEETTVAIPVACVPQEGTVFGELFGLCQLEIILEVLGASGGKSSTGATAARSHHTGPHLKVVVVGREKVTLKAGKRELVHVSLNTTGRRLLAQHHRLSVKLTITQKGHKKLASRTIVFKAGTAHKRH